MPNDTKTSHTFDLEIFQSNTTNLTKLNKRNVLYRFRNYSMIYLFMVHSFAKTVCRSEDVTLGPWTLNEEPSPKT